MKNMAIVPAKLRKGDTVRVVAPSHSLALISEDVRQIAMKRLESLGLVVTFGKHVEEEDEFISSSVASRVADLHEAFADPEVKAIFSVIGGFNCNQLLPYLDWELIKNNPKIFIGYSDTTALQNGMLARANLVTYSGPAYSSFGQKLYFDYTLENFKKCLFETGSFNINSSKEWTDDAWYIDQNDRHPVPNTGYWVVNQGEAEGMIVGGNLSTVQLLQGTAYFPTPDNIILFLEDDDESQYHHFDRQFESLLQSIPIKHIRGIVFGRFQNKSAITRENLETLVRIRPQLANTPIIANADFGHTSPMITFPVGGTVGLSVQDEEVNIAILKH